MVSQLIFFGGYGSCRNSFEQSYHCYPASFIDKHSCALIVHCYLNSTMMPLDVSHCGVLEFVAEEGFIYMAYQVMQNMLLQERETVRVKNITLPKAWKQLLRNFSCLTTGDNIMIAYNNKRAKACFCE
ncbi:uncharacterized protein [Typha latifolia]|uniref:uncharacterized protein n=1 Tax=Typha latifolia TaxID=4733 RepID=UPI003C2C37E5